MLGIDAERVKRYYEENTPLMVRLGQGVGGLMLLMNGVTWAADWLRYRGPSSDGSSPETFRTNWDEQPPEVVWRKPIGQGFSSPVISGGFVVTQERRRVNGAEREFCVCLDAATGDERWAVDVDVAVYDKAGTSDRNLLFHGRRDLSRHGHSDKKKSLRIDCPMRIFLWAAAEAAQRKILPTDPRRSVTGTRILGSRGQKGS